MITFSFHLNSDAAAGDVYAAPPANVSVGIISLKSNTIEGKRNLINYMSHTLGSTEAPDMCVCTQLGSYSETPGNNFS